MVFLLEDGNLIFTSAIVLMLMIALMEGLLTIIGFGLSQILDGLLPDIDVEAGISDVGHSNGLSRLLGWIRVGEVPALVILVLFLTIFGITGITLQMSIDALTGLLLPVWLATIPVLIVTMPCLRFFAGLLGRVALKDETEAISTSSFIGNIATITLGVASKGSPAEARFTDKFGTTHYTMVEPDNDNVHQQGDQVLLVEQVGSIFKVIESNNQHLNKAL